MASGIEHRSPDTVLQAYDAWERPNFAIYAGSMQKMYYDGDDMAEGKDRLQDMLSAIDESQNQTVYTLKVYEPNEKRITKRTPEAGSTTFMFCNTARTKNENGVVILDRTGNSPAGANQGQNYIMQRMNDLEKRLQDTREELAKEQIKNLQENFNNQIAGIKRDQEQKPGVWERLGETLIQKPELMDKVMDNVGNLVGALVRMATGGNKNFVQDHRQQVPGVNGTKTVPVPEQKKQPMAQQNNNTVVDAEQPATDQQPGEPGTQEVPVTDEGAYINPFLNEEQQKLKNNKKFPIMQEALAKLTQKQLDDQQMICVELLEARLGALNLTHLLVMVACMDSDDLNKVMNNLAN